jgi:hypothetical protein
VRRLICFVGAVVAIVIAFPRTWDNLTAAHSQLDRASAQIAPAVHEQLDLPLIASWAAQVGPNDRWWIVVPADRPEGLTTRAEVYRAYATYAFLPAVPASSLADATVVFRPEALP